MAAYLPLFYDGQLLTDAAAPGASHYLYTYESGTTTPKATYTDAGGGTTNANPIALNSAGRLNLWLGTGGYSLELRAGLLPSGALVKRWDGVTTGHDIGATILADLANSASATKGAGMVAYDYTTAYTGGVGLKLNSMGVWAVADLEMDPTGVADCLAKLQAAWTAGYIVRFEPGLFALSAVVTPVDGCGIIGSGCAHWDRRSGYDYNIAQQTVFKYTGAGGANTCVIRASATAVGVEGTDFTTPGTDDLINIVLENFHIDGNGLADYPFYMYRVGGGSRIGNVTVEKGLKYNVVGLGLYALKLGPIGAFNAVQHGVAIGWDIFGWNSVEATCFALEGDFQLVGNGTANTFVLGSGTDEDNSGGKFSVGRGSKIRIDSEGNYGRACILSQYNIASGTGGTTIYETAYLENNGGGALIDYRPGMDGIIIRDGFIHPGTTSLVSQDFKLVAKDNSGVVTANTGPRKSTDWLLFERLQGDNAGRGFKIDSNTYKFKVRDCTSGINFPTRRPQPESVFAAGLFLADATLSDTRYVNGQARVDAFLGDGVTTDFTLSATVSGGAGGASFCEVSVAGTFKTVTTHYTVSGTTLHFTAGNVPTSNQVIVARYSNLVLSRTAAGRYQVDFSEDQPDVEYFVDLTLTQSTADAIAFLASKTVSGFEIRTTAPTSGAAAADLGAFVQFTVSRLVDQP